MFEFFGKLSEKHERLKERIHGFRIPLSPAGQRFMGFVYMCIPIVGGFYMMQAAIGESHKNLGIRGEKLSVKKSKETDEQNRALQEILDRVKLDKEKSNRGGD